MTHNTFKILFVCTGNSCRSPMAEGILKKILTDQGISRIIVESAGTMAPYEMKPTAFAQITTIERGIDISKHRSIDISKSMIDKTDLILVMEKAHKRFIQNMTNAIEDKVFLLKGFGKRNEIEEEIEDPIGRDLEFYRSCYDSMEREIHRILPLILEKADQKG